RALIQLQRTAERYRRDAAISSTEAHGLSEKIEDTACDLWRRANNVAHTVREANSAVLQDVLEEESIYLEQLVQAVQAAHAQLLRVPFAGPSAIKDKAAYFRAFVDATQELTKRGDGGRS